MPESGDGGSENWQKDRIGSVIGKIVRGLDWWVSQSNEYARLKFIYDVPPRNLGAACPTEPIETSSDFADSWIKTTMLGLGYEDGPNPSGAMLTRAYINGLRVVHHTDWAFCIFVADSLNDFDGCFPNGRYACAYQGTSTVVITYDCGSYGHHMFDQVIRHEVGHVFGAKDEYAPCCGSCPSGYLYVANWNCEVGAACVMRYYCDGLCEYTRGQIGWRDSDGDGIWDPVDTDLACRATCLEGDSTSKRILRFTGSAEDIPTFTPSLTPVTINRVESVEFSVDNGPWTPAAPVDGTFDSPLESFTFEAVAAECGERVVNVRARNTVGNISSACTVRVVVVPDTTAPIVDWVRDDGLYTNNFSVLHAAWSASDPETGISEYRYAVGLTPEDAGAGYVRGWVSAGEHTGASIPIDLTPGQTYYVYVKAANSSGIWSNTAASNGITAVLSEPIGLVKKAAEGCEVCLSYKIVSAVAWNGEFYVQDDNRSSGLRVSAPAPVDVGERITLVGVMRTIPAGERLLEASSVDSVCFGETLPPPLGVSIPSALPSAGCFGLLIRMWGTAEESGNGLWVLRSSHYHQNSPYVFVRPPAGAVLSPGVFVALNGVLGLEQMPIGGIVVPVLTATSLTLL